MRLRQYLMCSVAWLCGFLVCAAAACSQEPARGQGAARSSTLEQDEQAIRAAAQQYIEALRRNDAEALHALWVAEGDIVDELGRARSAHQVIDEEARTRMADATGDRATSTIDVTRSTIRFLTSRVAIEDGRVDVSNGPTGSTALRGRFTALWVKQDGRWRLASLRETRVPTTTAGDLAALDWMVGRWTGKIDEVTFDVTARWNAKHTLLERDLTLSRDGKAIFTGEQRIGVDPLDGRIKSWVHDSDGGHGEGVWRRHGNDGWIVQAAGVAPDGRRTLATNVYTYNGSDQMTWKSTGSFSGGRATPDFEITLNRVPAEARAR